MERRCTCKSYLVFRVFFIICFVLSMVGCSKKIIPFFPENPPPKIFIVNDLPLSIIGPPPLRVIENEFMTKSIMNYSQYFKIAVLPCIDKTGHSDHIKNSLADAFYTSLFSTQRFRLMDRMELKEIEEIVLEDIKLADTSQVDKDIVSKVVEQQLEVYKASATTEREIINILKGRTDGILEIFITSDKKSVNGSIGSIGIEYRIVSTMHPEDNNVLFAGRKQIRYRYNKLNKSLDFYTEDIDDVGLEIKNKFPNPDMQEDLKIIEKKGRIITVNAGKNDNIISGMLGFVIRIENDLSGNKLISYRAMFEVKEVFVETFRATLIINEDNIEEKEEDEIIIPTITINEPVKMK